MLKPVNMARAFMGTTARPAGNISGKPNDSNHPYGQNSQNDDWAAKVGLAI
jgi:hypothetical protein